MTVSHWASMCCDGIYTGMTHEPSFDVPLVNVTVVAGQSIVLQCSIDNLGKYKVMGSLSIIHRSILGLLLVDKRPFLSALLYTAKLIE